MLGGLARWLRAAGYDAAWRADIDDWELIHQARREQRLLLSSDSGIFRIGVVRDGEVPSLFLPLGLSKLQQLSFVLHQLHLPLREPRCMACGGVLVKVDRANLGERVPARTLGWLEHFYECSRCGHVFWQGTHWQQIAARLEQAQSR
jgi:uncharacterized protein with PIN domain